jgi:hypothetical protein
MTHIIILNLELAVRALDIVTIITMANGFCTFLILR